MSSLVGTLSAKQGMTGTLSPVGVLSGSLTIGGRATYERYDGEYEVIPSTEEQILETEMKLAKKNIIIKPIPQNYGLITWDGSTITVS